jgi:hypothetical protein
VKKEQKTAKEIVALIQKDLKIPGLYLEMFAHRNVTPQRCQASSLRDVFNLTWIGSSSVYESSAI